MYTVLVASIWKRRARTRLSGDTNKALAVFLGMTASNFSTIWNGRQPFQRKHIVRIAVRYQLSPQDVWDIFFLADAEAIKKEAREA